jgi:hypothetical protein
VLFGAENCEEADPALKVGRVVELGGSGGAGCGGLGFCWTTVKDDLSAIKGAFGASFFFKRRGSFLP